MPDTSFSSKITMHRRMPQIVDNIRICIGAGEMVLAYSSVTRIVFMQQWLEYISYEWLKYHVLDVDLKGMCVCVLPLFLQYLWESWSWIGLT